MTDPHQDTCIGRPGCPHVHCRKCHECPTVNGFGMFGHCGQCIGQKRDTAADGTQWITGDDSISRNVPDSQFTKHENCGHTQGWQPGEPVTANPIRARVSIGGGEPIGDVLMRSQMRTITHDQQPLPLDGDCPTCGERIVDLVRKLRRGEDERTNRLAIRSRECAAELDMTRRSLILAKRQRDRAIHRVHSVTPGWHPDHDGPYH